MIEQKNYYIAKRYVPTLLKPYYIGLGLLSKTETDKIVKNVIGEIFLEICDDKQDYDNKLLEYRKQGFCLF